MTQKKSRKCPECNGNKKVPTGLPRDEITCTRCNGRGRIKMTQKKGKKSQVGYTFPHWQTGFTKSHPNWKGRVFMYGIYSKKTPLADVKVRITIQEVYKCSTSW